MTAGIAVEIVTDIGRFDDLRTEWDGLMARAARPSPFLQWDWVRMCWRRVALRQPGAPLVALVRDAQTLVLAAPMMRNRRAYLFHMLGGLHTSLTQYTDVLVQRGGPADSWLETLLTRLGRHPLRINFGLDRLPGDSGLVPVMGPHLRRKSKVAEAGGADLSNGYDAYFAGFSRSARYEYRRKLKGMAEAGGANFRVATPDRFRSDFQWLLDTKKSWTPRRGELRSWLIDGTGETDIVGLCLDWITDGRAELGMLEIGGTRAAGSLMLRAGDRALGFLIGFDPQFAEHSPGRMLALMQMERAASTGVQGFDFMGTHSEWKDRLANVATPTYKIRLRLPRRQ